MPLRLRQFLSFCLLALSMALSLFIGPASGQSFDNSLESLQMMQGLSPEQRDAISRQLGGFGAGGLGGTQGALGGRLQQGDEEPKNLMRQQQRDLLMDTQKQRAELERLSPFLQGEDWVVITIDSNPLPAETPATPQTVLPSNVLGNLPSNLAASKAAAAAALAAGTGAPNIAAGGSRQAQLLPDTQAMIDLIRSKNPYQLSRGGVLELPGLAPIPLAGLTEQLAMLRLGVE